eukprot:jgi/Tetstr1/465146/TSEL_009869.t1
MGGLRLGGMEKAADLEAFVVHGGDEPVDAIGAAVGDRSVEEALVDEAHVDLIVAGECMLPLEPSYASEAVLSSCGNCLERVKRGVEQQLALDSGSKVSSVSAAELTGWWRGVYQTGDGECGSGCEQEKLRLCALQPAACILMRCWDLAQGHGQQEFTAMCNALENMDEPVQLGIELEEMLYRWRLYHSLPPRTCDEAYTAAELQRTKEIWRLHSTLGDRQCSDRCQEFKKKTCTSNSMLCMEMSCENAWSLLGDASILDLCDAFYPIPGPRVPAGAQRISSSLFRQEWVWLAFLNPGCDQACASSRMDMCPQHPAICLKLACLDVQGGGIHAIPAMAPICDLMGLP